MHWRSNKYTMKYYCDSTKFLENVRAIDKSLLTSNVSEANIAVIDESSISIDLSGVPKVIFFTTETIPKDTAWTNQMNWLIQRFNVLPAQLYFIATGLDLGHNGKILPFPLGSDRIFLFNYFFKQVVINNSLSGINFNYTVHRPKIFDCLLGARKPHRIFIYNRLIESGLLDKSLVNLNEGSPWEKNYFNVEEAHREILKGPGYTDIDHLPVYSSPELAQWEIPVVDSFKEETQNKFYSSEITRKLTNQYGQHPQLSSLVPNEIYNNSYYSIVAETGGELSHFLSEKIAKPVFAKRVFVLFGSAGLLQHFRNMGFKTFDSIIDESYDNEESNLRRFTMAWEQCLKLASMDPVEVYNKLASVLGYNQQHLLNTDSELLKLQRFMEKPGTC